MTNPNELKFRADERRRCAEVIREYARGAGEPRGVGPCHAAAEAMEIGARLMLREKSYSEPAVPAEQKVFSTPAKVLA